MTDLQLLREYVTARSEDAFTALARKYAGMVYSAARRQTNDPQEAEDITQAVFLVLAQKAAKLPDGTVLSAWLLQTTRFVALNSRRKQLRRPPTQPIDEQMHATDTEQAWSSVAPLLDEALLALNDANRNAIALRFFEGRSYKEMALLLGITDDAAQKRVSRALELMRGHFAKDGLVLTSSLLVAAMGTHVVQAAPVQVIAAVSAAAGSTGAGGGNALALAKVALETMRRARRRDLLASSGVAALLLILALFGWHWFVSSPSSPASTQLVQKPAAPIRENTSVQPGAPASQPPLVAGDNNFILVHVVDSVSGVPIPNALLFSKLINRSGFSLASPGTNVFVTDENGECRVPLNRRLGDAEWDFYIGILKDSYAIQGTNWSSAHGDVINELPKECVARLEPAAEMGGVVVDDQGQLIRGAKVLLRAKNGRGASPVAPLLPEGMFGMVDYHTELTDAQGHWHCTHIPHDFQNISMTVTSPDYAVRLLVLDPQSAASGNFLAGTARIVLESNPAVSGVVTDDTGTPIPRAKIIEAANWSSPWATHWTDANGHFRFSFPQRQSELVLKVEADGYASSLRVIELRTNIDNLQFSLVRTLPLRGRVVNEEGAPIRAMVFPQGQDRRSEPDWHMETDRDGRFEWLSAPPGQKSYSFRAAGYRGIHVELDADGSEHVVTLSRSTQPPPPVVAGTVTDEQSGQPVDHFEVWLGFTAETTMDTGVAPILPNQPGPAYTTNVNSPVHAIMEPSLRASGRQGKFAFPCREYAASYTLQIRADGYFTHQLSFPGPLRTNCSFELKLKKQGR